MALQRIGLLLALFSVPPTAQARLHERRQDPHQQLSASGASSGAEANPEVDAWHDQEKAKIEADCDAMMRKLWDAKRQKLQDIVDALKKKVRDAQAEMEAAKQGLDKEVDDVEEEKSHLEKAKKPIDLSDARKDVADWEAKVKALEDKIAELKACEDELAKAQKELEEALRKLEEAERNLEEAKAAHADQVHDADVEASHVPPARDDVEAAEDYLARAKARVKAAEERLAKARADLAEHDDATGGASLGLDKAEAKEPEPARFPEGPAPQKSAAATRTGGLAVAAAILLAALP
jgi:chromosome segregation ATPase